MPRYSVIRNFQSLDVISQSQYQFSHVKIDTSLEVNFATFFWGGAKSSPSSVSLNNNCLIKACLYFVFFPSLSSTVKQTRSQFGTDLQNFPTNPFTIEFKFHIMNQNIAITF